MPTFIVGTGRCGSTMVSNILREHPSILSISEFYSHIIDYGGRIEPVFAREPLDGRDFWNLISAIAPRESLLLRHDLAIPEVLYAYRSPQSRFSKETGVPAILHVTLPHLTDRCDELFEELGKAVTCWPSSTIRQHYDRLFDWLRHRFDKKIWIERSGGIFLIIDRLFNTFPEARFIHIVRDGRAASRSMANHLAFRLFLVAELLTDLLNVDPYEDSDRSRIAKLTPQMRKFLPESFDTQAFTEYRPSLQIFGEFWSKLIIKGIGILNKLPRRRVLTLRYEDFFTAPRENLHKLAEFLGPEYMDPIWEEKAVQMIRHPRFSNSGLAKDDQAILQAACQPGFEALRAMGVVYDMVV
jgi:putative sulfotransferase